MRLLALLACVAFAVGAGATPASADEASSGLTELKRGLKRREAPERAAAVRQGERLARRFSPTQRRSAAVAVKKALGAEREPAVRAAMVRALSRFGGATGWVTVILTWFHATDEAARGAARQALLRGGGDYLEVVTRLLEEETDPTFRANLALLLGDRRRSDAVPVLLTRLGDDHPRVVSAAAQALEAITGQLHGYDAQAWGAWWEVESRKLPTTTEGPPPGETVTVTEDETPLPEPPLHVPRSLVPEFYGLRITAKDVVFVLDISGSVGAGGVTRAKNELVRAVESLGSDVYVSALFFDEEVHMWEPGMVRATPQNKAALALFLRGIKRGRKTDVFTPLNAGLQIVRRRVAARKAAGEPIREAITMIVVSDGVETHNRTPPHVVADKLERLDPAHTVVHAVALGGKGSNLLLQLARRGGGHYVQAR